MKRQTWKVSVQLSTGSTLGPVFKYARNSAIKAGEELMRRGSSGSWERDIKGITKTATSTTIPLASLNGLGFAVIQVEQVPA